MNRFPLPPDDRLAQLLREAFDQMPGPDMRRINQLESRLVRTADVVRPRHKLNTLPWWVVMLVAGSLAAAAWWAGETLLVSPTVDDRVPSQPDSTPADTVPSDTNTDSGASGDGAADPGQYEQGTPFIYQREAL